ncbi:hypothetical protein [Streptomyces antibioticus]|uniref:Uncharacterized protein n=1 Tax=Streptomyces antibioticus TaxID=1890 RepID=A0AAE7CMG8_STRAT|nr:hypothetical protein [Streptomyces antibioticus]QIT46641.1 hypothetical protein HCX60_26550 [Streptomyces antibioticus]
MSDIPEAVRRTVIKEIYRKADELGWDGLSPADRTTWYNRWIDDEMLGGVLTRYMPRERARMWIKDVPMKHYNRARSGIGPYADLVSTPLPSAYDIARIALGEDWTVLSGTLREKPNRCQVTDGQDQMLLIWGNPRNLKSLVWAGLNARVDGLPSPIVVISLLQGERLTESEKRRHQKVCELAGLNVRVITSRAARTTPADLGRPSLRLPES